METQIRLPDGRVIQLNEQQIEALSMVRDFLTNKLVLPTNDGTPYGNRNLFRLQGFAGTGKSTIIKQAIDWFGDGPGRWDRETVVTAPTHKAKKVISEFTGRKGKTIQSLLGLAPNTDVLHFDINKPEFAVKNKPGIERCSVILIDEAGMLGKDLYQMIKDQATIYKVKIIFMCDGAQLPPVKEELSMVLTDPELVFGYALTKVERQAGDNPLMSVYDNIRNDIKSIGDQFKHTSNLIESAESRVKKHGVEFVTELSSFGSKVVSAFASEKFAADPSYTKLLCWTNDRVKYWNDQIRKTIILNRRQKASMEELTSHQGLLHDNVLMIGELLMGYSNTGDMVNAGEYKVGSIEYREEIMEFGDKVNGEYPYEAGVAVYDVHFLDVDNPNITFDCSIIEPTTENYKKFIPVFNWFLSQGKFHRRWPMYFGWRERYLLLTDIRDAANKVLVKKDLDYAYALTVHKSLIKLALIKPIKLTGISLELHTLPVAAMTAA